MQRRDMVLLLFILLGWGLRVYRIDTQELRGDEAFSWNYVSDEAGPTSLVKRIVREGDPQPPLHYLVLKNWVSIFGDREWAMRAPSAFLSIVLVPLVYQFAARAASISVGLVAAAITVLHPFQVWMAQDVRNMYQLALCFGLVATLMLPELLRGRRAYWFGYVLCGTLAMYSHYYALFVLLAHGVFVALSPREQGDLKGPMRWASAGLLIALVVLPWAIVILPVYAEAQLADPTQMSLGEYLGRTGASLALGPTIELSVGLPAAGVSLLLCVVGAASARRVSPGSWCGLLITWPLIALVGIYVVMLRRATFNPFYFLVAFPAMYTLFGCGWLTLMDLKPAGRAVGGMVGVVGLVLFGMAMRNYYFIPEWSKNRGLREIAAILQDESREGDLYIPNFPDPAQDYYLRNLELPRHMLPGHSDASPDEIEEALGILSDQHERMWFVPIDAAQWDDAKRVRAQLSEDFFLEASYIARKLQLLRYVSDPKLASEYRSLCEPTEGGPKLMGAQVAANGLPADSHLASGDRLRVSLVWEALSPVDFDYTVFVHAMDSHGRLIAQHDGTPQSGSRLTSTWQVGETILDVHEFPLPKTVETDAVSLSVGMYLAQSGERLIWENGADQMKLGKFVVVDQK